MTATVNESDAAAWTRSVRMGWRNLTGGPDTPDEARATLVACSGGADSAGLAIALAGVERARVVLALVAHDLRPADLVADDIEAARWLARQLGRPLVVESVRVRDGNAEAAARSARYAALAGIAGSLGIPFVATAHHAVDQFETMVGALLRGGSVSAMAGIRPSRLLDGNATTLIRPMLGCDASGAQQLCQNFGYTPRSDHTNADPARFRAQLRSMPLSSVANATEGLGQRLARTTRVMREVAGQFSPDAAKYPRTSASSRSNSETCDTL